MKIQISMQNIFPSLVTVAIFIFTLSLLSCSKDNDELGNEKEVTSFAFLTSNNTISKNVVGQINNNTNSITAVMPHGTDLNGLIPEIIVTDGATVNPNTVQDFNHPVEYTVTAENGSSSKYTATVTVELNEREILQKILDANPGNSIGWDLNNTPNIGDLFGVTTNFEGSIIELFIPARNVRNIPAEIGGLKQLRKLAIIEGRLTSIPREIGLLTNLIELNLEDNQITSDGIPAEIGLLNKLTNLRLSENNIIVLRPEIFNLSALESLELWDNLIAVLPGEISKLVNLQRLNVGSNNLNSLPSGLFTLSNLTWLMLLNNKITGISEEIGNLLNLRFLNISNNSITSIPREIGKLTLVYFLSLSGNPINSIPSEIAFLNDLEELRLRDTNLNGIPGAIKNYVSASGGLQITYDGNVGNIIETNELDQLISIYSSNPGNRLGWGVDHYPEVEFTAEGNPRAMSINNKNLRRFPRDFGTNSPSLKTMHASQNTFESIPSSLGYCTSLEVLTFHGVNTSTVPSNFRRLTKLALLTLTGNPITNIPQAVCDLQKSNGGILTILTDPGEGCK